MNGRSGSETGIGHVFRNGRNPLQYGVLLVAALVALWGVPGEAQPKPDLVISNFTVTPTRVGVRERVQYDVTVKNIDVAPCNLIEVTVNLPSNLKSPSPASGGPRCTVVVATNVVRCTWDPAVLLGPNMFVTASISGTAPDNAGTLAPATAIADPLNRCKNEASESNNSGTSPGVTVIKRPDLQLSVGGPNRATVGTEQTYAATITNVGEGPANNVRLEIETTFGELGSVVGQTCSSLPCTLKEPLNPRETRTVGLKVRMPKEGMTVVIRGKVTTQDEVELRNNQGEAVTNLTN